MKAAMATRSPAAVTIEKEGCTEFVLHKSQQTVFSGIQEKIVDYAEHRLIRYALKVSDQQQKLVLMALISDYRAGHVAIAWKRGMPIYVRVTKS